MRRVCGDDHYAVETYSIRGQIDKIRTDRANSENPVIIFHNRTLKTWENNSISAVNGV